jgi:hypothetical protein
MRNGHPPDFAGMCSGFEVVEGLMRGDTVSMGTDAFLARYLAHIPGDPAQNRIRLWHSALAHYAEYVREVLSE